MTTPTTPTQPQPTAPAQGSHFFAITLQAPGYDGFEINTYSGTVTPAPGQTRYDLYQQLRNEIAASNPDMARSNTLFFSVESNAL